MTREEEIKEIYRYIWEEVEGYDLTWESDCDKLAERLYEDGWRRQIEAEWIPMTERIPRVDKSISLYYKCSNCGNNEYSNNIKYCPECGAKMKEK